MYVHIDGERLNLDGKNKRVKEEAFERGKMA